VNRDASPEQIKRAYRRMSIKLHPDVAETDSANSDTEERMKEVNQAYQVLSDPEKRQMYDMGQDPLASQADNFGPFGRSNSPFGDVFEAVFNMATGSMRSSGPVSRQQRGRDQLVSVTIDLTDAVFGTSRQITVSTYLTCSTCTGNGCAPGSEPVTCQTCGGNGMVGQMVRSLLGTVRTTAPCPACEGFGSIISQPCGQCQGVGRVRGKQTITVDLPAGVDTGNRLPLPGQGEAGPGGGPNGDLYVEVRVRQHPDFIRQKDDLHCAVALPMTAAALGAQLTVTTFDGDQTVEVAPGTQNGHVVVLNGLGCGHLGGRGRGDLHVHIDVQIAKPDDEEQRDLLRRLAALRGEERPEGQLVSNSGGVFARLRDKLTGK
jgi:molecular chaperone DnaJ